MGNRVGTHPAGAAFKVDVPTKTCAVCNVVCDGLQYRTDLFKGSDHHCWIYYSHGRAEITTSASMSLDILAGKLGGENQFCSISRKEGQPLVKFFVKEGTYKFHCTNCFQSEYPEIFKSACLSLSGKASIINSEYNFNKANYGNI